MATLIEYNCTYDKCMELANTLHCKYFYIFQKKTTGQHGVIAFFSFPKTRNISTANLEVDYHIIKSHLNIIQYLSDFGKQNMIIYPVSKPRYRCISPTTRSHDIAVQIYIKSSHNMLLMSHIPHLSKKKEDDQKNDDQNNDDPKQSMNYNENCQYLENRQLIDGTTYTILKTHLWFKQKIFRGVGGQELLYKLLVEKLQFLYNHSKISGSHVQKFCWDVLGLNQLLPETMERHFYRREGHHQDFSLILHSFDPDTDKVYDEVK